MVSLVFLPFVFQSYIVYLGSHSHGPNPSPADLESATNSHYKLLSYVLGSPDKAKEAIFYSYNRHINGFAALLEEEEAAEIASKQIINICIYCHEHQRTQHKYDILTGPENPDVVSVLLSQSYKLHTTRSWEFLGLEKNGIVPKDSAWEKARYGEDTIIANIDSEVFGLNPKALVMKELVLSHQSGEGKLIGARFLSKGYEAMFGKLNSSLYSARDHDGHGTHTLSTAGGNFVEGVNAFGNGYGTAKGGSPKPHVASYKVCWEDHCLSSDILAAFDAAINDGVHVISISLGGSPGLLSRDAIAVGSFHAMANGIVVVSSAGNEGPQALTVINVAPWLFTVAASTIDRDFASFVSLGDNKRLKGASLSSTSLPSQNFFPLISAEDANLPATLPGNAKICRNGTLDPNKVKGKILVCLRRGPERSEEGLQASLAGAVGMILANEDKSGNDLTADPHVLPAAHINFTDGEYVYSYIKNNKTPVANMTSPKTELGTKPAPVVTLFSSRGPNPTVPSVLKPDITAPGLNIIAAYSGDGSPSYLASDKRRVAYNSMSGTSMSSPHVAGIVGLLKTLHPDWSPASIKSAIMTTASTADNSGRPIADESLQEMTPFAYGGGHVQPDLAIDPGLVYDLNVEDYLKLLCSYNYSQRGLAQFYNKTFTCPKSYNIVDFNYPAITVLDLRKQSVNVTRVVTNVGSPSTYQVHARAPRGVFVSVEPSSWTFKQVGETQTYKVVLTANGGVKPTTEYVFGELRWSDGIHNVKSPIVSEGSSLAPSLSQYPLSSVSSTDP
ncbi:hypothetical protein L6164_030952 [Bauhinia variegata]|uniref:Uncharacterized protein n=1 Tax=Bauhinia variegata TaxID=167791 RepID=A0ACB9LDK2_BAUVA|nr:hypothetical protein L6164_030952 [Bauhinia variegata]